VSAGAQRGDGLPDCSGASDFYNMVHTPATGRRFGCCAPLRLFFIVMR